MSFLDRPLNPETEAWASRLLLLRTAPPEPRESYETTLRAWRDRWLQAGDLPEPDAAVAAAPVTRNDAVWAYRVYLGRDPECEEALVDWLGVPSLADLARLIRETPEFQAQRLPDKAARTINLAGAQATIVGSPEDLYVQNIVAVAELLRPFERVVRAVARTRDGGFEAVDIGAHLGLTAILMSRLLPGSRIIAVEPAPGIASHLRPNLERNGLAGAEVVEAAIGRLDGEALFNLHHYAAGSHLVAAGEEHKATHRVPLMTLERLCETRGIRNLGLLKLDVEGFERDVLEGGLAALHRMRPVVHLEFNAWAQLAMSDANPRHFLEWLIAEFPCVFSLSSDGTTWHRLQGWQALPTLHRNMIERSCIEDLVVSWDESWTEGLS